MTILKAGPSTCTASMAQTKIPPSDSDDNKESNGSGCASTGSKDLPIWATLLVLAGLKLPHRQQSQTT